MRKDRTSNDNRKPTYGKTCGIYLLEKSKNLQILSQYHIILSTIILEHVLTHGSTSRLMLLSFQNIFGYFYFSTCT
jgi:cAMP phosphodiesterase